VKKKEATQAHSMYGRQTPEGKKKDNPPKKKTIPKDHEKRLGKAIRGLHSSNCELREIYYY
jgi:hypothetical protein